MPYAEHTLDAAVLLAAYGRELPFCDPESGEFWAGHPGLRAVALLQEAAMIAEAQPRIIVPEAIAKAVGYDPERLFDLILAARRAGDNAAHRADTTEAPLDPEEPVMIGPHPHALARIALEAACERIARAVDQELE